MTQPVIYTKNGLLFSAWAEAWPQATITEPTAGCTQDAAFALVWAGLDNWLEVVTRCSQHQAVMVFGHKNTVAELQTALSAGARGYLDFASPAETLKLAGESVQHGALWIPHEFLANLVGALNKVLPAPTEDPFAELSEREQQVTRAVCRGLTNRAIAEELSISERTVKQHLTASFAKLGVKDRMQLLLLKRS